MLAQRPAYDVTSSSPDAKRIRTAYLCGIDWMPARTKAGASAAGSSRGRNRWPVVSGPAIRSTRKERQSWRSRS